VTAGHLERFAALGGSQLVQRHVANRELATLEQVDASGRLHLRLDSGRAVALTVEAQPHLDYGYAVTSPGSQGQTMDRVVVHVETGRGEPLVNRRLAYVAVSRGRFDAQIYTDDAAQLGHALSRDVGKRSALESVHAPAGQGQTVEPSRVGRPEKPLGIAR
jgi:ATP-dependent exoDNAse (exonuclease V) alpha subunit